MRRCVYFLRSGDAIKIGCSVRPQKRAAQISIDIGNKVEMIGAIYGNFATERLLHKHLAAFAQGREWFSDCEEVRSLIAYLINHGPFFQGIPMEKA